MPFFHLLPGLTSGLFPSGSPIKILYGLPSIRATCPAHRKILNLLTVNILLRKIHKVPFTIFSIHPLRVFRHVPIVSLPLCFEMPSQCVHSPYRHKPSPTPIPGDNLKRRILACVHDYFEPVRTEAAMS
jgi:hypothetical protein